MSTCPGTTSTGPLPELPPSNNCQSRQALFVARGRGRDNLGIRQLYRRACTANGHRTIVGTPEAIADDLEHWYRAGAADGFVLIPAWLPGWARRLHRARRADPAAPRPVPHRL